MNKENKYYNLIVEKVKAHPRFLGIENLLEDIIDDVYTHSQVVINSVTNEEVVDAYLNKVISTSIITVPKRLNVSTRANKKKSSSIEELTIDKSIQDFTPLDDKFNISNTKIEFKKRNKQEDINIDKTLVEKMINGVSAPESKLDLDVRSEEQDEVLEEADTIEEFIEEQDEVLEEADTIEEFIEEQDEVLEEADTIEEFIEEQDEVLEEADTIEEFIEEQDEVLEEADTIEEFIEEQDEALEETDTIEEFIEEQDEALEEADTIEEFIEEQDEVLEDADTIEEFIEEQDEENKNFSPDYSMFNFNPNITLIEPEEIVTSIGKIQKDYPNIDISLICDLRYNKKETVANIANKVNIDTLEIVEILNAISAHIP